MKKKLRLICRLEIHRPRPVGMHDKQAPGTYMKKWFCPLCGQSWYSEKKYFGIKQYTYSGVSNPPNISKSGKTEFVGFPMMGTTLNGTRWVKFPDHVFSNGIRYPSISLTNVPPWSVFPGSTAQYNERYAVTACSDLGQFGF
jgi:hypothetical protein